MAAFISLEGIDRSGKSTQAALLADALGPGTVLVREPGGTEVGERVRELLKDPSVQLSPRAELMLFCAARAELVERAIRPALAEGCHVVCDRFGDSTAAYQGAARGLGIEEAERVIETATGGLRPDLTVFVRVAPELAAGRDAETGDRFEDEGIELQRRVARGYELLLERHPERIVVVDGDGTVADVQARVLLAVTGRLGDIAGGFPIASADEDGR